MQAGKLTVHVFVCDDGRRVRRPISSRYVRIGSANVSNNNSIKSLNYHTALVTRRHTTDTHPTRETAHYTRLVAGFHTQAYVNFLKSDLVCFGPSR